MNTFLLEIITPERLAFAEPVETVTVPTENGHIGVLHGHVPLFTALTEGEVKIQQKDKEYYLAIGGGFMQVTKHKVSVLVSRAVHADEMNEAEIKKAQDAAKDAITNQVKGIELANAQAVLRRSLLEMKVLRKRRNTPTRI